MTKGLPRHKETWWWNRDVEWVHIAPIAQSVSALDFNFERAVEGSILTAGKRSENLNVIIRAIN